MRQQLVLLAISFTWLPALVHGFSFQLNNTPTQCQNTTFEIVGSGTPPYSLLLIPYGSSPLSNNTEVRRIQSIQFGSNATSLSVQLIYPSNSQFVAVVSDSTGFGNGGTSTATTVQSSSDSSCYDLSEPSQAAFYFSINPLNQLIQCKPSRIWWDNSNNTVQGTPNFQGVIPGGQSFKIPQGNITNVSQEGTGFSWTPTVRAGTTVMIVGGDNRQMGNAGSAFYIMSSPLDNDNSCVDSSSPSSTPGSAAGSVATGSPAGSHTTGSSSSTPVGGIVGGVVGGVVVIVVAILAAIYIRRRRRLNNSSKERPTLFLDNDDDGPSEGRRDHLPQYYEPEPFTLPEPTEGSRDNSTSDPRQSLLTYVTDGPPRAGTPDGGTATSRKSSAPPSLRPVNFIVHEDAGPSTIPEGVEPETVELPPAYTNLRS